LARTLSAELHDNAISILVMGTSGPGMSTGLFAPYSACSSCKAVRWAIRCAWAHSVPAANSWIAASNRAAQSSPSCSSHVDCLTRGAGACMSTASGCCGCSWAPGCCGWAAPGCTVAVAELLQVVVGGRCRVRHWVAVVGQCQVAVAELLQVVVGRQC
jgi:hypothetical protein